MKTIKGKFLLSLPDIDVKKKEFQDFNVITVPTKYVGVNTKGGQTEKVKEYLIMNYNPRMSGGTHKTNILKEYKLKDTGHSLEELAEVSAVPLHILEEVYDRGIGAYKTNPQSVRLKNSYVKNVKAPMKKKLSKEQWAMARVYSFLDGNPEHDNDLRKIGGVKSCVGWFCPPTKTSAVAPEEPPAPKPQPRPHPYPNLPPFKPYSKPYPEEHRRENNTWITGEEQAQDVERSIKEIDDKIISGEILNPGQNYADMKDAVRYWRKFHEKPYQRKERVPYEHMPFGVDEQLMRERIADAAAMYPELIPDVLNQTRGYELHSGTHGPGRITEAMREQGIVNDRFENPHDVLQDSYDQYLREEEQRKLAKGRPSKKRKIGGIETEEEKQDRLKREAAHRRRLEEKEEVRQAKIREFNQRKDAEHRERIRKQEAIAENERQARYALDPYAELFDLQRKKDMDIEMERRLALSMARTPQDYANITYRIKQMPLGATATDAYRAQQAHIQSIGRLNEGVKRLTPEPLSGLTYRKITDPDELLRQKIEVEKIKAREFPQAPPVRIEPTSPRLVFQEREFAPPIIYSPTQPAREVTTKELKDELDKLQEEVDSGRSIYRAKGRPSKKRKVCGGCMGVCGGSVSNFQKKLDKMGFSPEQYIKIARKVGQRLGYNPSKIVFCNRGTNKLMYESPNGTVHFGNPDYPDFIIYSWLEHKGEVPSGTADKRRELYRKRATNIKGDWKKNKYSANNLAINILW